MRISEKTLTEDHRVLDTRIRREGIILADITGFGTEDGYGALERPDSSNVWVLFDAESQPRHVLRSALSTIAAYRIVPTSKGDPGTKPVLEDFAYEPRLRATGTTSLGMPTEMFTPLSQWERTVVSFD